MNRFSPLYVVIAATLWAVDGIVLRPALFALPVALVVLVESTIVALLLTPFFVRRLFTLKNLRAADWLAFIGVAILGGAVGTMAITKALFFVNYVNLSIVILIQKLQPAFALLLAAVLLKERLSWTFFFWATLAVIGAYLATFGLNLPNFTTGDKTEAAAFFALVAAIAFASSTVLSKRALENVGFQMGTYLRFVMAALFMVVVALASGATSQVDRITQKQLLLFLLIAVTTGGPGVFIYYYGLKRIKASVAAICELAFPLSAVLLEYFIRGNMLSLMQWAGVLALFMGIFQVTRVQAGSSTPGAANRRLSEVPGTLEAT